MYFEVDRGRERERERMTRKTIPIFYVSHFEKGCFKVIPTFGKCCSRKQIKES